ncbi:aminoacyl-tRNA hydrolase [Clostridium sp.]|uniref:aminoacyl-tRNA hydrolase n=1 Tax=Clostridium sp. TaxID=1506 RepID=UPI0026DB5077|nr:aminoacyl-tRNA hydrolase [Clostridium sp.]MDO5038376.1 aminoacyl-tRNA hydrolase [Clostridium sp.]
MFIIVGLGNIGEKYENTRHNIGFDSVDYIANKYNIDINRKKFKGVYGEGFIEGEKVILIKPSTFMNLSGECVREILDFYKLTNEDIIVLYDDISLDVGKIRIREKGSAGGHNGIKNIISHLGTDKFSRIKIGVGQPKGDLINHVLGNFSKEEREVLEESLDVTKLAVDEIIKSDISSAMNKYNGFKAKKSI